MGIRLECGTMLEDVPLFPLNVVLFPGMPLPLHIFEPRYREMIGLCAQEERPFGVLLIKEGTEVGSPARPFEVGTLAKIVGVDRLDDGRMNIVTLGTQRFRLLQFSTEKRSYLVGDIQLLEEGASPQGLDPLARDVLGLVRRYVTMVQMVAGQELVVPDAPSEPSDLSHFVGATLRIDNLERQRLLEAESALSRLQMEKDILVRENKNLDDYLRERKQGGLGPFSRN